MATSTAVDLVTGARNSPHVTSAQQRALNAAIFGTGACILSGCDAIMQDANTFHVSAGYLMVQGAFVSVPDSALTIENGSQNVKRRDLVCLRYAIASGIELATLVVKQGTPATNPVDPSYTQGSILNGDSTVEVPLWRVSLDGITPSAPEWLSPGFSPIVGLQYRAVKNIKMTLPAGWGRWDVTAFDAFSDIPAASVIMAIPVMSAANVDGSQVKVHWNTWSGNNKIEIYTPVAQDVYFNMILLWA